MEDLSAALNLTAIHQAFLALKINVVGTRKDMQNG